MIVGAGRAESGAADTEEMHPADLADVAEALPRERVAEFLTALPSARAADVLEYLNEDLRSEFFSTYVPKLWDVGITVPDEELRWDSRQNDWAWGSEGQRVALGMGPAF